jgi:serine/arginine repetitive matrix protein 1
MDSRNGTAFRGFFFLFLKFLGVSLEQDSRYSNKKIIEMKKLVVPKEFDEKLNFEKIKLEPIKAWISKRTQELLGVEDDILIQYIFEMLQAKVNKT